MLFVRCLRNVCLLSMATLTMCGVLLYGNDRLVQFGIREGLAKETIKQFAEQAEVELLFDASAHSEVRTNPVFGPFTVQQALEQFLRDTPLVAIPVSQGNAFGIVDRSKYGNAEDPPPQLENESLLNNSQNNSMNPEELNNKRNRSFLGGLLSALLVATAPAAKGQEDDENVFELSPFTVDASEDTGYVATSTLAGTRIRTNLKDLGSAISVYTSEFMDDTAATDAGTLLSYTTNTEVGGIQGNFSGAEDAGDGRYYQTGARTNPQFNQRIRGLGSADLTRGFFLTDIPFDSFNTDRVTVSRGPNSLLFGIGSPGGVINNNTKQAIQGNDFGELSIRVDNYKSWRTEFDYNKSLVQDRVAVRLSVLKQDQKYKQEPAYEDATRFYGALDIVLFENEASDVLDATRLRINGEDGEYNSSPVEIIPPTIAYHGWFEPISRSLEQYTGIPVADNVVSPSEGGTWEFQETFSPFETNQESAINTNSHPDIFRHIGIVYNQHDALTADLGTGDGLQGFTGIIPWNRGRGDTFLRSGLYGTPGAGDAAPDDIVPSMTEYHANSPYSEPYAIGFAAPTVQNRDVFDYRNKIYSGGIDQVDRKFDAINFALEQSFFDNQFAIELAYDRQHYETYQDFFFTGGNGTSTTGPYDIYVAISEYLLNGQPNPNLGRAYTRVARPETRFSESDRETFRITGFATFDFTENDGFLKWLGRHRFTGLYNNYEQNTHSMNWREAWDSNDFDIGAAVAGFTLDHFRRPVNTLVFTSDSLLGLTSMDQVRLQQIQIPRPQPGDEFNVFYADVNSTYPTSDRKIDSGVVYLKRYLDNEGVGRTEIDAKAAAWQSYLFDENIVGLLGYRKDDTKNFGRKSVADRGIPDRLDDGSYDPEFAQLSDIPSLAESGDTVSWSVVGRYPENLLGNLPGGMDFQVHYAESENFNPIGLRNNALGQAIGQPTGTTKEYGFLASFAENKFSVRVNWFETALNDVDAAPRVNVAGEIAGRINGYRDAELNEQPFSWQLQTVSGAPEDFPVQDYATFYDRMEATFPDTLRQIVSPRRVDSDNDGLWDRLEFDAIPALRSTQDRISEGFEIEFVASPTPGWRILANVSQQETVQSNSASVMAAVVEEYNQKLQSSRLGELNRSPDGTVQVRTINSIWLVDGVAPIRATTALDNTIANEQREWRFSAVTTYRFMEGGLKGFSVGGAARWEDEAATGYLYKLEPDTGVPIPDVTHPYFDDGLFTGDLWIGYQKQLTDKIDWQVQLNVRNAFGDNDDIPVKTNPDGQVAVVRIPNPRTIYLSNTFKF